MAKREMSARRMRRKTRSPGLCFFLFLLLGSLSLHAGEQVFDFWGFSGSGFDGL